MWQVIARIPIPGMPEGLPIFGFGLMLFFAFIVCTWLAGRRGERAGISKETVQDLAIWIFVGGLLGARIAYLVQQEPRPSLWNMITTLYRIWDGGIILYGSVIGAVASFLLAYFLIYRRRGLSPLTFCDVAAPTVALGLAFGRLGCLLNGCCYGQVACAECAVVPVPFPLCAPCREFLVHQGHQTVAGFTVNDPPRAEGVKDGAEVGLVEPGSPAYEAGLRPGSVIVEVNGNSIAPKAQHSAAQLLGQQLALPTWPRGQEKLTLTFRPAPKAEPVTETFVPRSLGLYPTQLYEVVSMLLLFALLLAYEPFRTAPGQLTAMLMVGYGLHRWLNEILRDDPRPKGFEAWGSAVLIAGGVVLWLYLSRRRPAETASTAERPAPHPA